MQRYMKEHLNLLATRMIAFGKIFQVTNTREVKYGINLINRHDSAKT